MTLYLKYRPKVLDELDLTSVRETLKKLVSSGQIPHAILFSGPKGLGKTSAARILAKAINCEHPTSEGEPCNKCKQCKAIDSGTHLDIIELDAASNRGIDDIRSLREAVKLAPALAKKKVYIVDEAHMLTTEASNALLKTLEEPPAHVMFILATTNPEKLIDTVRSRATNILFTKPSKEELLRSLSRVVKGEKIKIENDMLLKIAEGSGDSFRDAVKILETFVIDGGTLDFKNSLGSDTSVDSLLTSIFAKDAKSALLLVEKMVSQGVSMETYIKAILSKIRLAILADVGIGEGKIEGVRMDELIMLTKMLSKNISLMRGAPIEQLPLEIVIVQWCGGSESMKPKAEDFKSKPEHEEVVSKKKDEDEILIDTKADVLTSGTPEQTLELEASAWSKILSAAKPKNKSIEALLRSAKPIGYDGHTLTLGVFYSFHKERLESSPHRQILDEIITEVFGKGIRVVCTLTSPPPSAVETTKDQEGVVLTESTNTQINDSLTEPGGSDIMKAAKEMFGN